MFKKLFNYHAQKELQRIRLEPFLLNMMKAMLAESDRLIKSKRLNDAKRILDTVKLLTQMII